MDRFKQSGHAGTAESWVGVARTNPTPLQFEQAIGPEVLETLSIQAGLSREEPTREVVPQKAASRWKRTFRPPKAATDSSDLCRDQGEISNPKTGLAKQRDYGGQQ